MLQQRYALITGASKGIGKQTAHLFAKNGANLLLVARDIDALVSLRDELQEFSINVDIFSCDLTDENEIKSLFIKIKKVTKIIDIVVNNAGIIKSSMFSMTNSDTLKDMFQTNLYAPYILTQYATRMMRKSPYASVIFISSMMATKGGIGHSAYASSKSALDGMMKSLAKELAPAIRVNAIAPGVVQTDMIKTLSEDEKEEYTSKSLFKRLATPNDIANVILFLASDMSKYITAELINVDGGIC